MKSTFCDGGGKSTPPQARGNGLADKTAKQADEGLGVTSEAPMLEKAADSYMHTCKISHFSHVLLFGAQYTIAHKAPLSMKLSRQEYWSGLPCPSSGDFPDRSIKPVFLMFPALSVRFFTTSPT